MKTITKLFALLFLLIFTVGCGDDDDSTPPQVNNEFTIQGTDYTTPNAYLILDDGPSFTNAFMLAFLEGTMREDNVNGSSLSTNNNHGIVLQIQLGNTNVTSEQAVTNNITNNSNFSLTDETTAITNIANYSNTYFNSGIEYGDPDDAGATLFEIGLTGNGTVTINSFTVDLITRTGIVDCTYSFLDDNGVTVNGQYNGNFGIINEF